jgi:RES domain-containing protein
LKHGEARGRFWRMLAPRWAHQPLSGAGAALHGGRWNERGRPALYMSETYLTAIAEYEQDLGIRPGTLVAYDVAIGPIVDLCDKATLGQYSIAETALRSPWKEILLVENRRPPSWDIAERLIEDGAAGIRVPSVRIAGANLVLWSWNEGDVTDVVALDPLGDLPVDQRSWRPSP